MSGRDMSDVIFRRDVINGQDGAVVQFRRDRIAHICAAHPGALLRRPLIRYAAAVIDEQHVVCGDAAVVKAAVGEVEVEVSVIVDVPERHAAAATGVVEASSD